ncbi:hypothetical protein EV426DRAFT_705109 [Tirmania nivea]|nr:hypothetical protein EV426DRAFT_705109 [Tirmania nivea]
MEGVLHRRHRQSVTHSLRGSLGRQKGNPKSSTHSYLGEEATVADSERQALVLALKAHRETPMVAILSDSASAISAAINIPRGPLSEEANKLATFASALGQISLQEPTVTEGGIRQLSKAHDRRQGPPLDTVLDGQSGIVTPYQLTHGSLIRALASVGTIPRMANILLSTAPNTMTRELTLGGIKDWEDLDCLIWIQEENGNDWDAVKAFFGFLYRRMAGRRGP